ncbi:radical SAM protein [Candidatus Woesearchaeota archaeon]|nr:radical SAM protein [Candidatus Woesearchaeota archaeon]
MAITILDCYTDEPAGLGVPPYLGTYPRYLYGYLKEEHETINYLTIDDLRLHIFYQGKIKEKAQTDIKTYNLTKNYPHISKILSETNELIIIVGVHAPGKYLSALPGILHEVLRLVKDIKCKKVLTGPALYGTSLEGGKFFEKADLQKFDEVRNYNFPFAKVAGYAVSGAELVKQIPDYRIIELETGRGCSSKGCNFCTEPLKSRLMFRRKEDIILEMKAMHENGVVDFRLGKQACFYTYPGPDKLLERIREEIKDIRTLHIDNVIPSMVLSSRGDRITEAIVKHCTPGNIAAFGVESFDPAIIEANNLACDAETSFEAIKRVNELGREMGKNGMPKYLPGINILFGLEAESKQSQEENMKWLKKIYDDGLLVRRINIRQVAVFPGTKLYERCGNKYLRKNKRYYWKWRNEIRQKIDFPMLRRLVPKGSILKGIRTEVHDGNTTFGRQIGSYPLSVGIKKKLPLKKFYDIKVEDHMLRSVVGSIQ